MSRIAFLDTMIDPGKLNNARKFYHYSVLENPVAYNEVNDYSHGTACACILDHLTENYNLYNIEILPDTPVHQGKPKGSVRDMKKGLLLCRELDVDIICMSAVTSFLSDSGEIYDIVQEISSKSIFVAALDNRGYVTVPSSYPFVIGVQADRNNMLKPGEIASCKDSILHTDIYANCSFPWIVDMKCRSSNSLAVPVAASHMNGWINKGLEIRSMAEQLKRYPHPAYSCLQEISAGVQRDIPVVMTYGDDEKYVSYVSRLLMDDMYKKYQVQATCISTVGEPYDIRVKQAGFNEEDLAVMMKYYRTDLILIASGRDFYTKNNKKINADADIYLKKDTEKFTVSCGNRKSVHQIHDLTETIYRILT